MINVLREYRLININTGEEVYDPEGTEALIPDIENKQTFGALRFEGIIMGDFTITILDSLRLL